MAEKIYTSLPDEIVRYGKKYKLDASLSAQRILGDATVDFSDKRFLKVLVLSKNLRGRTDLHGRLYQPSVHVFRRVD